MNIFPFRVMSPRSSLQVKERGGRKEINLHLHHHLLHHLLLPLLFLLYLPILVKKREVLEEIRGRKKREGKEREGKKR